MVFQKKFSFQEELYRKGYFNLLSIYEQGIVSYLPKSVKSVIDFLIEGGKYEINGTYIKEIDAIIPDAERYSKKCKEYEKEYTKTKEENMRLTSMAMDAEAAKEYSEKLQEEVNNEQELKRQAQIDADTKGDFIRAQGLEKRFEEWKIENGHEDIDE